VPLLAWQPLFWWLRRSVRLDLELLADAAAAGDQPIEYAEALVAWAKRAGRVPAGLAALSLWESPHTLSRRVTMLLDPKRPKLAAPQRGWKICLACASAALIAGMSLLTLRSRTADGQEAATTADRAAATDSADAVPTMIALQFVILEADRADLEEVLPVVEKRWQPDPETDVTLQEQHQWLDRLKMLTAKKGTRILSRPQVQTLDGQVAHVQIGSRSPPLAPADEKPLDLGLKIELTPRLIQENGERRVALAYEAVQTDLKEASDSPNRTVAERKLAGKVVVPVERQAVIIAHRPRNPDLRPLVLAVMAYVVQRDAAEQEPQPPARADDLPRLVRQLERQLAERTREAQAQRDHSESLRKQVDDLKKQLDKLLAAAAPERTNTAFYLKYQKATDVERTLKTLLKEARLLGGDAQLDSIQVQAEDSTNSLIVTAPPKHWDALKTIIARLDQGDQQAAGGLPFPRGRSNAPAPVPRAEPAENTPSSRRQQDENIARAERETQMELLKLDLQEAEIGLEAAHKDLERVRVLQKNNAISQEEVAKHELQAKAAQIKVMRVKIMLDAARHLTKLPINAVDGPRPPHNPPR
jgi:hypothetical protein